LEGFVMLEIVEQNLCDIADSLSIHSPFLRFLLASA
jgi:hypothetical protein